MNLSCFVERLPATIRDDLSKVALNAWFFIHSHVCRYGQTDRYDSVLRKGLYDCSGKWVSEQALKKHLRKMEVAGLLESHQIKVKFTHIGKAMWPFSGLFGVREDGPAPGVFIRYTLPGMRPTLEMQKPPPTSKKR